MRRAALDWMRFWVMRTKRERKMASRLTIIVSMPKGKGSNGFRPNSPELAPIQKVKKAALM